MIARVSIEMKLVDTLRTFFLGRDVTQREWGVANELRLSSGLQRDFVPRDLAKRGQ